MKSMLRIATLVCVLLSFMAGCDRNVELRPLTVVGWGGSSQDAMRKAFWQPFTEATGIALREDSWHGGVGVIRTKVIGGDTSWDVVSVETEDLILGCEEGLFEPLQWATLGGRDAFIGTAVSRCGVGSEQWSYLIGYDGDVFPQGGPANWSEFWDVERFPGKRGMRKTPKYALEFALLADGVPAVEVYPSLRTAEGVTRAFAKLDELKPHVIWWSSISQVPDLLGSGEVVMSVTSPGRLVVANRTDDRNFKLAWDGNVYAVDYWAVLSNSPRRAEAMQLIEYMSKPEGQMRLARLIPTGVTNKQAGEALEAEFRRHTTSNPDNMKNALELDGDFWVEYGDQLTQRFNAWVAR
jgi:putative spermidine/putrescine transport system substrate-binding protein